MLGTVASSLSKTPLANPTQCLTLRIEGTERHGQEVRISGPNCTIGSAPECTLRLRAPGVQPLHCRIIQSLGTARIESLAETTWLNCETFDTARLEPGDRLKIGPIQFLILAVGTAIGSEIAQPKLRQSPKTRTTVPKARNSNFDPSKHGLKSDDNDTDFVGHRRRQIAGKTDVWNQRDAKTSDYEYRQLREQAQNLRDVCRKLATEREELQRDCNARQNQLQLNRTELARLQQEIEGHSAAVSQQREQLQSEKDELAVERRRAEVLRKELTELRDGLDSQRRHLECQQKQLREKSAQLAAREGVLDSARAEIATREKEQEELHTDLLEQFRELTEEKQSFSEEIDTLKSQLSTERKQLESLRETLQSHRDEWQTERDRYEKQIADSEAAAERQLEQLQQQKGELLEHQQKLEDELAEIKSQVDEQSDFEAARRELDAAYVALEQERSELISDRESLEKERLAIQQNDDLRKQQTCEPLDEEFEQLESEHEELETQTEEEENEESHDAYTASDEIEQTPTLETHSQSISETYATSEAAIDQTVAQDELANDFATSEEFDDIEISGELAGEVTAVASHDESEVSELKVGESLDLAAEDGEAVIDEEPQLSSLDPEILSQGLAAELRLDDELCDESIEQYMSRLLQRVSGTVSDLHAAQPQERPAVASVENSELSVPSLLASMKEVAQEDHVRGQAGDTEEDQLQPKHVAPESGVNIAAMRELANYSATSAIQKCQRSRHVSAAMNKTLVAGMTLLMSTMMFILSGDSIIGYLAACVAFVAASLWAVQAVLLFQRGKHASKTGQVAEQSAEEEAIATTVSEAYEAVADDVESTEASDEEVPVA